MTLKTNVPKQKSRGTGEGERKKDTSFKRGINLVNEIQPRFSEKAKTFGHETFAHRHKKVNTMK